MDNGVQTEPVLSDPLDVLGHDWRVLHTVGRSDGSGDHDVLAVGPPGVVALTARRRPGSTVWVGARSVTVDGGHTVILHNARSYAERSSALLTSASGRPIDVVPVVVLAELESRAAARGYARMHLTTGPRQPEAKALYLAAGWTPLFDPAVLRPTDAASLRRLPVAQRLYAFEKFLGELA